MRIAQCDFKSSAAEGQPANFANILDLPEVGAIIPLLAALRLQQQIVWGNDAKTQLGGIQLIAGAYQSAGQPSRLGFPSFKTPWD